MSSAKSRNFRRRGDAGEEGNNYNDATARKASLELKPKKLLSFAEDEDENTPSRPSSKSSASRKPTSRLSNHSSSHKLMVYRDRLHPVPSSNTSNLLPQPGTYTKEVLLELQKNTCTLGKPSSKTVSSSTSEPKIILKDPSSETLEEPQHLYSEDEEDKIWEEEQFRKGLGKRMGDEIGTNRVFKTVPSIGGASLSIQQQGEMAKKALLENFQRLQESYSRTVSSLSKTNENLSASLKKIASLEKSVSAAAGDRDIARRFREAF